MKRKHFLPALFLSIAFLIGCIMPTAVSAADEVAKIMLMASPSSDEENNFLMGNNLKIKTDGTAFSMEVIDYNVQLFDNCLWMVPREWIEMAPYLVFDVANNGPKDQGPVFTMLINWGTADMAAGEVRAYDNVRCNNLNGTNIVDLKKIITEDLKESTAEKLWISFYTGVISGDPESYREPLQFNEVYLSSVPKAVEGPGKIPEPERLPEVPDVDPVHEVRYQLQSSTEDNDEIGFYLHPDAKVTVKDKGFELTRKEGSTAEAFNIAWVIPLEQLKKTPYLMLEIGNTGRDDEGTIIYMHAYWENGTPNTVVKFNDFAKTRRANTLNGFNKFPLLDAVNTLKVKTDEVALAIGVSIERADGTTLDPLVIKDAYLYGEDENVINSIAPSEPEEPASSAPASTIASDSSAPAGSDQGSSSWVLILCIVGGVVVLAAAAVCVYFFVIKKKGTKKND